MKGTCTIYYTSDIHAFLFPTDYVDSDPVPMGLLSCMSLIEKDGNTLVLDGGDTIQGSPLAHHLRNDRGNRFPITTVMNEISYDYVTLGNHDFDYGYEGLSEFLGNLEAQCLCANVIDRKGKLPIAPHAVRTLENGLRVGIVGLVTDYVTVWEPAENLEGLQIAGAFEAAREAMRELAGKVDLLIGIYHGGYDCDPRDGTEFSRSDGDIACRLCKELDFDLLLTGHQHLHHAGSYLYGTYTVQPRGDAREVCRLSMAVDGQGNVAVEPEWLVPAARIPDRALRCAALLQNLEDAAQRYLDTPVGALQEPLGFESRLDMALHGNRIATLINQVQLEASGAQISCTCLYNTGKGLGQTVTARNILTMYQFPNTLKVLGVTGAVLRVALEQCAAYFDLDRNGCPVVAKRFSRSERQHYDYDYFLGILYRFDLSRPVGERLVELNYQGRAVQDGDSFSLCMNSYRATGSGGYACYRPCPVLRDMQSEIPQLLIAYFERHDAIPQIPPSPFTVQGYEAC